MKRIWTRIGIVAGILAMGGFGAYLGRPGTSDPAGPEVAAGFEPSPEGASPSPLPLPTDDEQPFRTPAVEPDTFSSAEYQAPLPTHESSYDSDQQIRPVAQFAHEQEPDVTDDGGYQPSYVAPVEDTSDVEPTETDAGDLMALPANPYRREDAATETLSDDTVDYSAVPTDATDAALAAPDASYSEDATTGGGYNTYRAADADAASPESAVVESTVDAVSPEYDVADAPVYSSADAPATDDVAPDDSVVDQTPVDDSAEDVTSSRRTLPAATPVDATTVDATVGGGETAAPYEPPVTQYSPAPLNASVRNGAAEGTFGGASTTPVSIPTGSLTSNVPGTKELEGVQAPTISVEKRAPREVQVGNPATFEIIVRNTGTVTAHNVIVTDSVPRGTELSDASPRPAATAEGALAWNLGALDPGDDAKITMQLIPLIEGEIGSVAQATFNAQASVSTISTKPQLVLKHTGPEQVLVGDNVIFDITLSNPGTGAATGIILEEDVPQGLAHGQGRELEYEVGTLRPRESKRLQLVLKADSAGTVNNLLRATADGNIEAVDEVQLEVVSPALQLGIRAPTKRYLERKVTYEIGLANPGTAPGHDIELSAKLPKGMKFVSADNKGTYDPRTHAVYWGLEELPAQETGVVTLVALPVETGDQSLSVEATGNLGLSQKVEHTTAVEAITELVFSVSDVQDPIEVGAETIYEIRVINNGGKTATNVQLAAALPPELTPLDGKGPTSVTIEGQQVVMGVLSEIGPREEVLYKLTVRGSDAGDHVIDVRLISDEVSRPVIKQESTKVYSDE